MSGKFGNWEKNLRRPPEVVGLDGAPVELRLRPAELPDPQSIPPRQWLYGTHLLRSFVTVLVAPGGTGKSAYAMAVGLSLASGRNLLAINPANPGLGDNHIHQRVNVAYINLEDPRDELNRRLASLMIHHCVDREEVAGRYFLHSGEDRRITVAAPDDTGYEVHYPDEAALIREIKANEVGLLIVDPFAESHSLEENSNPDMVKAAAAWRRIARETNCAVWLIHHVRKGAVTDIDAARGAKALTDSARIGLVMMPMSDEEAKSLGIPVGERWSYVRLDDAKANMAPRAAEAKWHRLAMESLGNGSEDWPNGDRVAAIERWAPPDAFDGLSIAECNDMLDIIAAGLPDGQLYAPTRRGRNNTRWAGNVLMKERDIEEGPAARIIISWLKSGLLEQTTFHHDGKELSGVTVNPSKRPGGQF